MSTDGYRTKYIIEVDANHYSSCDSFFQTIVDALSFPAVNRVTLLSGETTDDIKPMTPSKTRKNIMNVMKKVKFIELKGDEVDS